ncbi:MULTISPECIES: DUF1641 domain-containing protein [Planococcus]|uniref:DUF1641 domain-containing protein n=1 Tax=Planococcus kocurii TaxID=1374 RepID=A0ABM5WWD8_9BACL|nr:MULTISPECIES: DUF1641 domain-containing protein [Planococcus]ALS78658.1 hypothetical protein AUO94_08275 [Planococcus kocurii]KAA0956518.1 DUF1641 domain-containing protein [Planococcus sp. ANT_H30]MDJ0333404.1 DUF1641 domain-containing protein [Planococcus sp. S3-L1]
MASPITQIKKRQWTPEEIRQQKLYELESLIAEQNQALNKLLAITGDLDDAGVLDAVVAMVKAKEGISEVVMGQATRVPVTNLINNMMGAAAALTAIEPASTEKLASSVVNGLKEAESQNHNGKKLGVLQMVKAFRDPDINRAIKFGLNFLKGMGKGLDR